MGTVKSIITSKWFIGGACLAAGFVAGMVVYKPTPAPAPAP